MSILDSLLKTFGFSDKPTEKSTGQDTSSSESTSQPTKQETMGAARAARMMAESDPERAARMAELMEKLTGPKVPLKHDHLKQHGPAAEDISEPTQTQQRLPTDTSEPAQEQHTLAGNDKLPQQH